MGRVVKNKTTTIEEMMPFKRRRAISFLKERNKFIHLKRWSSYTSSGCDAVAYIPLAAANITNLFKISILIETVVRYFQFGSLAEATAVDRFSPNLNRIRFFFSFFCFYMHISHTFPLVTIVLI